jgi:hypothetical protein
MTWLLLFGALFLGYGIGKAESILRMSRWLKSLSPWDQETVKSLLRQGTRCDENAEFDARTRQQPH